MIAQNLQWIKECLYVDAKDKHGDWQVGLVLAVTKFHIKIRFDGWSSKTDELYPLNTQRIKPFRSITKGYTGQKKYPAIRQHWDWSIQNHDLRLSQFEEFVEHISQKSGFEINQYLRGQNYFYIDHLLVLPYTNLEQIKKVYAYFKAYFQFVKTYMQQFIERDTNTWFQAGQKQQMTAKKAYTNYHFQIFESVVSIIGSHPRPFVFLKNNEKIVRQLTAPEISYQTFIVKQLQSIQFFAKFEELSAKMFDETLNGMRNIPFPFINSVYSFFAGLEKLPLTLYYKKKINTNFVYVIQQYMQTLTVQEAKVNERCIEEILNLMRILSNKMQIEKEQICKWVEKAKLKLWISLIQCDVLQKKLRGINKIKDFYDLIVKKLVNPFQNSVVICSKDQFREWMQEEQLLKIIFETNEHSEVIKKGCEMVQYFYACKHQLCRMQEVVYIWKTCFKKHEAIKKIIFQFWNELPEYVSGDQDWKLFIGVLIENEDQITEDWQMQSLFIFLHSIKSDDENESISNIIDMMYRKTLKSQKFVASLARQLSYFDGDSNNLRRIIDNCLQKISLKNEPIFHIKLLAQLFSELHKFKIYLPEKIIVVLIYELQDFIRDQQNEKFIITIFHLLDEIMAAKDNGISTGNPNGVKFTFENFQSLWQIFRYTPFPHFKKILYVWMVQKSFHSSYNMTFYTINHNFNHELRMEIFSNVLCDPSKFNYTKMDSNEFIIFKQFFIYTNVKAGIFQARQWALGSNGATNKKILRTKSKDIQGLNELWEVFKNCQNDEVVVSTCTLLKDIYLRVSTLMPAEEKIERIKNLMETIQSVIIEGQKNQCFFVIKKILILISKLLTEIKDKVEIPKELERSRTQKITLSTYITSFADAQQIQVYVQEPFVNIKSLIAQKYHLSKDQFTIYNGKSQVPKEVYDLPFNLHKFDDSYFKIVKISNETGKYVVNYVYQHFYHRIISFLKNDNVCTEAYQLLEYLDIFEPAKLFEDLSKQIQQVHQIMKNKKKVYLHIFFIRVFLYLLDKQISHIDGSVLQKLISHLQMGIQSSLFVNYLQKLIDIFNNIVKKRPQLISPKEDVRQSSISLADFRPKIYILLLNLVKYVNKNPQYISNHEIRLFNTSLILYMTGFDTTKRLFDSFIKDQHFRELMFEIFIKCDIPHIKRAMERKITFWLKEGFYSRNQETKVAQFFINELYYEIYKRSAHKNLNGSQFVGTFKLFRNILETVSMQTFKKIVFQSHSPFENQVFSNHIFNSIQDLKDSPSSANFLLSGQLQILAGMIRRHRSLITPELIEFLFYKCLIFKQEKSDNGEVKCLSKENISLILQILWFSMVNIINQRETQQKSKISVLTLDKSAGTILNNFREFHYYEQWRNLKEWNYDFQQLSRTKIDFVGLQNPGCICYLNSLLQQLFMIQEFRSSILNMDTPNLMPENIEIQINTGDQDSPELIPKLKFLFLSLMYSQNSAIDPRFFTESLRTATNRPMVKIFEQMDIDEFSMILFDKIENKLHRSRTPNFIRQLFGGTYSNEIISQECNHSSEREEQFLSISLDVKKHIAEGFQSLVKGQILEGQNAYFCDGCDKKVKALKRLSIKRLPPHLIISLRRFQFDYQIDQKIKINKFCEFPLELNLQNYSQDKLNETNSKSKKKSDRSSMNEQQTQKPSEDKGKCHFPPEYYVYKLKGVVIHSGSADSGHYYSLIENKDGNWFEFNDQKVSAIDIKNLEEEAFGGKDGQYTKIKNAYLLFYERKVKTSFNNHTSDTTIVSQKSCNKLPEDASTDPIPTGNYFNQSLNESSRRALELLMNRQRSIYIPENRQMIEQIIVQNKKIRLCHFFFSKEYVQFIISFIKQALYPIYRITPSDVLKNLIDYKYVLQNQSNNKIVTLNQIINNNSDLENEIFQFLVSYTFLIQLRQKNIYLGFQLLDSIRKIFFQHPDQSRRLRFTKIFLEQICHQSFFDEFFVNCSVHEKKRVVGNFIFEVMASYLIMNIPAQPFPRIIKNILRLIIKTILTTNINISQLLTIMRKLFGLKQTSNINILPMVNFILEKDFVTVLIDNILKIESPKQIKARKIKAVLTDKINQTQDSSSPQSTQRPERKGSDLSAKDDSEQEVPTKRKICQKIDIEGSQNTSFQGPRNSVLFGSYQEQAGSSFTFTQKQSWMILWQIHSEIKIKKQAFDLIDKQMQTIKAAFSTNLQPKNQSNSLNSQNSQFNNPSQAENTTTNKVPNQSQQITNQPSAAQANQKPDYSFSPSSSQKVPLSPIRSPEDDGTEQLASESVEQSCEEQSSQQSEQSQLNEQDHNELNMELVINQVYAQVVQVPKQVNSLQVDAALENKNAEDIQGETLTNLQVPRTNNPLPGPQQISQNQNKDEPHPNDPIKSQQNKSPQSHQNQNPERQNLQNPHSAKIMPQECRLQLQQLQSQFWKCLKEYNRMNERFAFGVVKFKSDKLMRIISDQKDTKTMMALSTFLCQLISDNNGLNDIVLNAIEAGLKDFESSKYRPFFVLFQKMIQMEDGLAKKRRSQIIRILRNSLRINEKYFIECDLIHQYLLRYATLYPVFEHSLHQNPNFINEIKSWVHQKRVPGAQTIKKHRQSNCQRHAFRLHGIIISGDLKEYENLSTYKFQSFEKIKQLRFTSSIKYHKESKVGETYKKGDTIEYYYDVTNTWVKGIVQENYFGIIGVWFNNQNGKQDRMFFTEDDQKIKLKTASLFVESKPQKMEIQK